MDCEYAKSLSFSGLLCWSAFHSGGETRCLSNYCAQQLFNTGVQRCMAKRTMPSIDSKRGKSSFECCVLWAHTVLVVRWRIVVLVCRLAKDMNPALLLELSELCLVFKKGANRI